MCITRVRKFIVNMRNRFLICVLPTHLSPQNWMNIHPSIEQRIFELNPALDSRLATRKFKKTAKSTVI